MRNEIARMGTPVSRILKRPPSPLSLASVAPTEILSFIHPPTNLPSSTRMRCLRRIDIEPKQET